MTSVGLGWFGVVLAVSFWGSWGSFLKTKRVQATRIDSLELQVRGFFMAQLLRSWQGSFPSSAGKIALACKVY